MSSEPLSHPNEPEIDEVEAALSHLEVTLEGGHADKILVNVFSTQYLIGFLFCYSGTPVFKLKFLGGPLMIACVNVKISRQDAG